MSYYSDAVIRDGAVAYWRLGETSGNTAYDSIGSNHGTISGGVTLNQAGPLADDDKAMAFDGTSGKVTLPILTLPATFTFEAWINTSSAPPQMPILTWEGSRYFGLKASQLFFYQVFGPPFETRGGPVLNDSQWHHVVIKNDTVTTFMYVDGIQVHTLAQPHASYQGIPSIGYWVEYWNGLINDVSIYPTALTPAQVKTHHTLGLLKQFPLGSYADNVIRDGAVAYWRLGETSGTTAVDIIGGNNGTISGGVTLGQSGALSDGDKAMQFDGSTGIISCSAVSIPAACTIEAWIKGTGPSGFDVILTNRPPSTNDTVDIGLDGVGAAAIYVGAVGVTASRILTDGQFHHVVVVLTGTQTTIYSDGTQDGATTAQTHVTGNYPVHIGSELGQNTVNGTLDEVAIYPTALTAPQVANHHAVSKYATPFGESVGAGLVMNLVAGKIYSLPPRLVHITASAPVEVSVDGVTFTALTQEVTGASYVRTLESSCSLVAKPVRPIAIGA